MCTSARKSAGAMARLWRSTCLRVTGMHYVLDPGTSKPRSLALLKIAAGFVLLIAGGLLALPGIPGPGIPLMLLGLVLLSAHFHWARRALEWLRSLMRAKKKDGTHESRRR